MNLEKLKRSFWSKVSIGLSESCWNWTAHRNKSGGGSFNPVTCKKLGLSGKASRLAWVFTYGDVPEGLFVYHKCDNSACCNPNHLYLGTRKESKRDGRGTCYGSANGNAKLTESDVVAIRKDDRLRSAIAKEYKISWTLVDKIKRKERWKHVQDHV